MREDCRELVLAQERDESAGDENVAVRPRVRARPVRGQDPHVRKRRGEEGARAHDGWWRRPIRKAAFAGGPARPGRRSRGATDQTAGGTANDAADGQPCGESEDPGPNRPAYEPASRPVSGHADCPVYCPAHANCLTTS